MMIYDKKNPFAARLVENRLLTQAGSTKETRHCVIDIAGSGLSYTCGDSLGVYPANPPEMVADMIAALKASGDELVNLPNEAQPRPLREALLRSLSLAGPTTRTLKALQQRVTATDERELLESLLEPQNRSATQAWLAEREYIDLLEEYPSAVFKPQDFVDLLRKLQPRLYSIASSPKIYPETIHLTVAVVRYQTNQRERRGIASTWLAERVPINQPKVPAFIVPSHFSLPASDAADLIMVGPGTGVAPFRAFIQERGARGAQGRSWLFFGERNQSTDYLYGEDWETWHKQGVLTRLDLAWSRDQDERIYVQHKLLARAKPIWEWLSGGAYFYVCGDAKRMAKDVDQALHCIIREQGDLDDAAAVAFVRQLRKEKRYQRDVY